MRPRDSLYYALLGLLSTPRHGYDLYRRLAAPEGVGQVWRLGMSQMYAELKRLEADGLVEARSERQENRPAKKVFALTPAGRAAFTRWMRSPARGLREMRVEFLVRLYFAQGQGRAAAERLIRRQAESLRREVEALDAHATDSAYAALVRRFRRGQLEAALVWLEECLQSQAGIPSP